MASPDLWAYEEKPSHGVWVPAHVTLVMLGCQPDCGCGAGYEYLRIKRAENGIAKNADSLPTTRTVALDMCLRRKQHGNADAAIVAAIKALGASTRRVFVLHPISLMRLISSGWMPASRRFSLIMCKWHPMTFASRRMLAKLIMQSENQDVSAIEPQLLAAGLKAMVPQPGYNVHAIRHCPICLDRKCSVAIEPCQHVCCYLCLQKWVEEGHTTCWVCRADFQDAEIISWAWTTNPQKSSLPVVCGSRTGTLMLTNGCVGTKSNKNAVCGRV